MYRSTFVVRFSHKTVEFTSLVQLRAIRKQEVFIVLTIRTLDIKQRFHRSLHMTKRDCTFHFILFTSPTATRVHLWQCKVNE